MNKLGTYRIFPKSYGLLSLLLTMMHCMQVRLSWFRNSSSMSHRNMWIIASNKPGIQIFRIFIIF
jgi:hypothetical protein